MSGLVRITGSRSLSSDDVTEEPKLGREAPVWVPDTASNQCQECDKPFSFIVRRHHCRGCGRLLCSLCSSNTVPLQYLSWRISRVCKPCKVRLDEPNPRHRRSRSLSSLSSRDEDVSKLVREMQIESMKIRTMENEVTGLYCPVNNLPREILSKILNFLLHSDKKICRSVCHYWLQVLETSNFYRESLINFKEARPEQFKRGLETFEESQFENFKFSGITWMARPSFWSAVSDLLRSLDLVNCEITEKDVTAILLNLRRLHSLALVNCRDVFMSGTFLSNACERSEVGRNLAGLRSLKLDDNKYLNDILLIRITETTPNLKILSLSGCNIMNDPGIYLKHYPSSQDIQASASVLTFRILVKVVANLAASLQSVNLSRNTGVDLEMLSLVPGLDLNELNISSCGSVTHQGVLSFLQTNKNIHNLNLNICRRVFSGLPDTTLSVFNSLSKITTLSLCQLSIPSFRAISCLESLKSLEINGLDSPGAEIVCGLANLKTDCLTSLKARFLGAPSQDLVKVINKNNFSSLRTLDLSSGGENTVTDSLLQAICSNMPDLIHLNLSNNPGISDVGTLGLILEDTASINSVLEVKDTLQRHNKIAMGTKHENEIRLLSLRREMMVESLVEAGKPECGLFLLTKLLHLNLSMTSVSSLTLKLAINSPDLRSFNLGHNSSAVDDDGLYDFSIRHSHLEKLELGYTPISDTGLISCLSCLPRLVHLDISSCQEVTNAGLRALCQVSPQIETVLLSNCSNISLEAARSVELTLKNLNNIQTLGLCSEQGRFPQHHSSAAPPAPPQPRRN